MNWYNIWPIKPVIVFTVHSAVQARFEHSNHLFSVLGKIREKNAFLRMDIMWPPKEFAHSHHCLILKGKKWAEVMPMNPCYILVEMLHISLLLYSEIQKINRGNIEHWANLKKEQRDHE